LTCADRLGQELRASNDALLEALGRRLEGLAPLAAPIEAILVESPPLSTREGGLVKPGADPEIVFLEEGARTGREALAALQQIERDRSGIPTL